MMIKLSAASLFVFTAACTSQPNVDSTQGALTAAPSDVRFYTLLGDGDRLEATLINDDTCGMLFYNVTSPQAQQLAIWTVGVNGIRTDLAYPDPTGQRPRFYGVFAPSNATLNHHVDGYSQYDHYHIVSRASANPSDNLFDAFVVFPGPHFNPSTYQFVTTVDAMNQQIAAGILNPPITTVQAGLGPVVFQGINACDDRLDGLYHSAAGSTK